MVASWYECLPRIAIGPEIAVGLERNAESADALQGIPLACSRGEEIATL